MFQNLIDRFRKWLLDGSTTTVTTTTSGHIRRVVNGKVVMDRPMTECEMRQFNDEMQGRDLAKEMEDLQQELQDLFNDDSWSRPPKSNNQKTDWVKKRGVDMNVFEESKKIIEAFGIYSDMRGRAAACLQELLDKLNKLKEKAQ